MGVLKHGYLVSYCAGVDARPEVVLEGSRDGKQWKEYHFAYKPGDVYSAPPVLWPHQPRLDWQMWFAALGTLGHLSMHVWSAMHVCVFPRNRQFLISHVPHHGKPPCSHLWHRITPVLINEQHTDNVIIAPLHTFRR